MKLEVVIQLFVVCLYDSFISATPSQQFVVRQMALPTCGRETKEHRECHESEACSRRASPHIQSVFFIKRKSRTRAWAGNMGQFRSGCGKPVIQFCIFCVSIGKMKCMPGPFQVHAASNGHFISYISKNDCQPDASLQFTAVRSRAFIHARACVGHINWCLYGHEQAIT